MIDPITYWTPLFGGLTSFITLILKVIELLGKKKEVADFMNRLPNLLRLLTKFIAYSLTLVIPNVAIIWLFFYLAGISPDRLSEVNFFWAVVAQPTVGVSLYAYFWGKLIYPKLQQFLAEPRPPQRPGHRTRPASQSSRSGGRR